jgi:hypothetical protein
MKQARLAADARASIQQRLAALLSGSKKAAVDVEVGEMLAEDDELAVAGGGPTRFKQLRPKKTEEQKAAERAAALAVARSKSQLEDLISMMGSAAAVPAAAADPDAAEVARLQAELAAMAEVDWEVAADGLCTPENEICLEDL